jgi:hypothetical protein
VGIIIILVEREFDDKFLLVLELGLKYGVHKIFDISLEIRHELGKDNTTQNCLVQINSLYI